MTAGRPIGTQRQASAGLVLDVVPSIGRPAYRQLAEQLRHAIRQGVFQAGDPLPSTRLLSAETSINRNTLVAAFAELRAEGLLIAHGRNGTRVSPAYRPELRPGPKPASLRVVSPITAGRPKPGQAGVNSIDLSLGQTSLLAFPIEVWRRACREAGRHLPPGDYGDAAGDRELRVQIANYLARRRGFRVNPELLVVTSGAGRAIGLLARALLRPGDHAAAENPGYPRAVAEFRRCGATVHPIPVDPGIGLVCAALESLPVTTRVLHATPAHQYPLGGRLQLDRRYAVLDWARATGAIVIENDYDHEFHYDRGLLPPLAALDATHVAYVATFSKALSPSLRIGCICAAAGIVEAVKSLIRQEREQVSWPLQKILAWLLRTQELDRHLKRVVRHYRVLRDHLVEALSQLAPQLTVVGSEGGLHIALLGSAALNIPATAVRLGRNGVILESTNHYTISEALPLGLLVGYGHLRIPDIDRACARIAAALT